MTKKIVILLLIICFVRVWGQDNSLDRIRRLFENFEYEKVIQQSNTLLSLPNLGAATLSEIYLLRARSYFSLNNDDMTRMSFRDLLKVNKSFTPDKSVISPKLISMFNEVKSEMENVSGIQTNNPEEIAKIIKLAEENRDQVKSAFVKNIVLPGWGQIQLGANTKGWLLGGISTVSLASMVYFIFDSNKKENDYLKETDKSLLAEKYTSYNNSYRIRNISIAVYIAAWLCSQIDVLFFENSTFNISPTTGFNPRLEDNIQFSYRFPINL